MLSRTRPHSCSLSVGVVNFFFPKHLQETHWPAFLLHDGTERWEKWQCSTHLSLHSPLMWPLKFSMFRCITFFFGDQMHIECCKYSQPNWIKIVYSAGQQVSSSSQNWLWGFPCYYLLTTEKKQRRGKWCQTAMIPSWIWTRNIHTWNLSQHDFNMRYKMF